MTDWKLLREFMDHNSQRAFGQLVERHMMLVYWTCQRDVRDAALAEDATQTVFVLLAQKAAILSPNTSISGWLFRTARLVCKNLLRVEARRRQYEEEAFHLNQQSTCQDADWRQVEPWINNALSALSDADREVVLLRYFDDLSPQELAAQLGTTEATARKRISRAVERLRLFLAKNGVPVTAITLTALLTSHTARAAPLSTDAVTQYALQHALTAAPLSVPILHKVAGLLAGVAPQKAVAVVALTLLAVSVAVPLTISKAQQGSPPGAGFTDSAPGAVATGGESARRDSIAAARSTINSHYRDRLAKLNRGDLMGYLTAHTAPDFQFITPAGQGRPLSDLTNGVTTVPSAVASIDIQSYRINGNEASVIYHFHYEHLVPIGSTGRPQATREVEDSLLEDRWEKRSGEWVSVRSRRMENNNR